MLKKLLTYFFPSGMSTDEESIRRAKLTVGTYLIVGYFNINYIVISLLLDYNGGLYSQIPLLLVSILSLVLYKFSVKSYIVNTIFFFTCIISIAITIFFTKGYESFILPWIASTPIVALLVTNIRGGLITLIVCSGVLTLFYVFYLQGYPFPEDYNLNYKNIFSYTTHLGLILILFAVAVVFENAKNEALKNLDDKNVLLDKEKKRSDDLLLNILPNEIIAELKETGHSKAKLFNHVTVLFTDFVNFTKISEQMNPEELVAEIDYCFKGFDEIVERNEMEKIKTIGDAYLAVCGLPNEDEQHAIKSISAAQEMISFIHQRKMNGGKFDIRVGIHSGPLVAGIVGVKKFAYDIWGDTVNTASRMESSGETGKINISADTYSLIQNRFRCVYRGKIEAKNKGEIDMYFVEDNS
ncbi:MAG: adenylate/guanylate cyclase domain-containing protein [Bacteroidetes bacterium]|nr:adenylate/guanylate cyclase domain-containing protein [Bacteroidota bacterium]